MLLSWHFNKYELNDYLSPLCRVFTLILYSSSKSCSQEIQCCSYPVVTIQSVHITLFPKLNLLYFYINTFESMCALHNMAVFYSSLISCFPATFFRYFLNDSEIVPVAPVITGIAFVVKYHMCSISILRFLYFKTFSAPVFIKFLLS